MTARIDSTILHEIARVVEARSKVPERLTVHGKPYHITYLDDHKQRLEEAIRRRDDDRLGMLFGQLPSKVKYQLMRPSAAARKRAAAAKAKVKVKVRGRSAQAARGRSTRRRAARSR